VRSLSRTSRTSRLESATFRPQAIVVVPDETSYPATAAEYLKAARPVFICGPPKSGTTLLLSLLDAHPDILVFPEETKFVPRVMRERENANFAYLFERTDCRLLVRGKVGKEAGRRDYRDFDGVAFRALCKQYRDAFPNGYGLEDDARALLESLVAAYGAVSGAPSPKIWIEKTPLSELGLLEVFALWPEAKAIYVVRDPRDVFCSYNAKRMERAREQMSVDEFEQMLQSSVSAWSRALKQHPLRCCLLRYEDLVLAPEREMRRIAAFLDVRYSELLLQPTRAGREWTGNSMHHDAFSGVSSESVGMFRQNVAPAQLAKIEKALHKMMLRFGYAPEAQAATVDASARD
jgi:hypothetical protein